MKSQALREPHGWAAMQWRPHDVHGASLYVASLLKLLTAAQLMAQLESCSQAHNTTIGTFSPVQVSSL